MAVGLSRDLGGGIIKYPNDLGTIFNSNSGWGILVGYLCGKGVEAKISIEEGRLFVEVLKNGEEEFHFYADEIGKGPEVYELIDEIIVEAEVKAERS